MKQSWLWREWLPNAVTLTLIEVTTMPAGIVVVAAEGPSSDDARAVADDP